MLRDLTAFARYARRLPRFLAHPVGADESRRRLEGALAARQANFLELVRRAVFAHQGSPYRALLAHTGIEFGDVVRLVREDGVEGALARLYDAGVRVTHDEFKGRRPLERPGLALDTRAQDFDNPLLGARASRCVGCLARARHKGAFRPRFPRLPGGR